MVIIIYCIDFGLSLEFEPIGEKRFLIIGVRNIVVLQPFTGEHS
jgi:hypothetical protein